MNEDENRTMNFRQALSAAFEGAQIEKWHEYCTGDGTYYLIIGEALYFQKPNGLRDICRESFEELNDREWKIRAYPKQKPTRNELKTLMRRINADLSAVIETINQGLKSD